MPRDIEDDVRCAEGEGRAGRLSAVLLPELLEGQLRLEGLSLPLASPDA